MRESMGRKDEAGQESRGESKGKMERKKKPRRGYVHCLIVLLVLATALLADITGFNFCTRDDIDRIS